MKELDLKAHEIGSWQINDNEMAENLNVYIRSRIILVELTFLVGMIMWKDRSSFFEVLPIHIGELRVWDDDTWSR